MPSCLRKWLTTLGIFVHFELQPLSDAINPERNSGFNRRFNLAKFDSTLFLVHTLDLFVFVAIVLVGWGFFYSLGNCRKSSEMA